MVGFVLLGWFVGCWGCLSSLLWSLLLYVVVCCVVGWVLICLVCVLGLGFGGLVWCVWCLILVGVCWAGFVV